MHNSAQTPSAPEEVPFPSIEEVVTLEQRDRIAMNLSDRIAANTTAFSGSMLYVGLHIL